MIYKVIRSKGAGSLAHAAASAAYAEEKGHSPQELTGTALSRLASYINRATASPEVLGEQTSTADLVAELEARASLRPDCKRPFMHVVLSYHPEDQPILTAGIRAEIAQSFVHGLVSEEVERRKALKMPLDNLPDPDGMLYHFVSHNDQQHPHDHGIICRVDANAKLYYASYDYFVGQRLLRKAEQDYGLRPIRAQESDGAIVQKVLSAAERDPIAIVASDAWLQSADWQSFANFLEKNQVSCEPNNNGFRFRETSSNRSIAAASAGFRSDLSIAEIQKRWKALGAKTPSPEQIRREFMAVRNRSADSVGFQQALAVRQMALSGDTLTFRDSQYSAKNLKLRPESLRGPKGSVSPAKPRDPKIKDPWAAIASFKPQFDSRWTAPRALIEGLADDQIGPTQARINAVLKSKGLSHTWDNATKSMRVFAGKSAVVIPDEDATKYYQWCGVAERTALINAHNKQIWESLIKRVKPRQKIEDRETSCRVEGWADLGRMVFPDAAVTQGVKSNGIVIPWAWHNVHVDPGMGPWRAAFPYDKPQPISWKALLNGESIKREPWATLSIEGMGGPRIPKQKVLPPQKPKGPSWS